MFYTVHAPTGLLISQHSENLILVFLLAIISHFILDIVPHGDPKIEKWTNKKTPKKRFLKILAVDGIISFTLITIIFLKLKPRNPYPFLVGLLGAALPDLLWLPLKFKNIKPLKKYRKIHSKIHGLLKLKMPIWAGLTLQVLITALLVYLIFNV